MAPSAVGSARRACSVRGYRNCLAVGVVERGASAKACGVAFPTDSIVADVFNQDWDERLNTRVMELPDSVSAPGQDLGVALGTVQAWDFLLYHLTAL